ncbi:acrylyl-CoA reductase (NADPH) [Glaciihabitans tibetensis]|uniref:Acrylyl-CoA reductase (NADPH) n=1 Tax=Glaciihabitans tibetensis TaxID=1266600 RepID=A0A2T0VCH9_9MICO|nr:MDR family oxidoreductase [Glaciihabitans tibetensis]PRY67889.1 acrylyl-CoA reductase (NADPH) [Glaciihabitans tibetensis]
MFRSIFVTRAEDKSVHAALRENTTDDDLGPGDVLIDVTWSGINYKDGMALAGDRGVMRTNELIPGIDLVGTIAQIGAGTRADSLAADSAPDDRSPEADAAGLRVGDAVLLNGWGIGETHNGGLSERARVDSDWLVPLPKGISPRRAAAIGTAGFTAALSVLALERGGLGRGAADGSGEVLVTGASGGVGSIAIALLAAAGHRVVASSGRPEHRDYLLSLGASEVIGRDELESAGRPLQSQRWAGVIDGVGGQTLAAALAQTQYGATVAACGMVGGVELPTTVLPFILRGIHLSGINSVECPRELRLAAWGRLARDLDLDLLDSLTTEIPLADAITAGEQILAGKLHGRTVVNVRA